MREVPSYNNSDSVEGGDCNVKSIFRVFFRNAISRNNLLCQFSCLVINIQHEKRFNGR